MLGLTRQGIHHCHYPYRHSSLSSPTGALGPSFPGADGPK